MSDGYGYAVIELNGKFTHFYNHAEAFYFAENIGGVRAVCKVLNASGDLGMLNVWANMCERVKLQNVHNPRKFHVI